MAATAFPALIRAEYDASSTGFADFLRQADDAAGKAKRSFQSSFEEIKGVVADALSVPRNSFGSLDLGAGRFREASANAQAHAASLRQVATAAEALARETGDTTTATRAYISAARAAATEAEHSARETLAQAETYERLQNEVNKTAAATNAMLGASGRGTTANRALTNSLGSVRFAGIQANQQLQDIVVSIQGGQRASTVFAQQLPQLAFVLSGVEGAAGSMAARVGAAARFFAGGWGTAILFAGAVLTPFIAKLFETENTMGDLVAKMKEKAAQDELSRSANDAWARSIDGVNEATLKLNDSLTKQLKTQQQVDAETLAGAQRGLATQRTELGRLQKELGDAQASLSRARASISGGSGLASPEDDTAAQALVQRQLQRVADAQAALARQRTLVGKSQQNIRLATIPISERSVADKLDAGTAATDRYTAAQGRLREERRRGVISEQQFEVALLREQKVRDAALKAARDAAKISRGTSGLTDPTQASFAQVRDVVRTAFPGSIITSTTGGKHVAGSDHYAGRAIDFVPAGGVNSVTKDQVRKAVEAAGLEIRRNAAGIEQLFGPGDKGHSNHFHVAVSGYADALRNAKDASKELSDAQKQLESDLDLVGQRFDDAGKTAARSYDQTLAAIERLAPSIDFATGKIIPGKISGAEANGLRVQALGSYSQSRTDAANDNAQKLFSQSLGDFDEIVRNASDYQYDQVTAAADEFRAGVYGVTSALEQILGRGAGGAIGNLASLVTGQGKNDLVVSLSKVFSKGGKVELSPRASGRIDQIAGALNGAATGAAANQLIKPLTKAIGLQNSQAGASIGGALGSAVFKKLAPEAFKKLGDFAGPLGSIAGSLLGGVIGGLFKKTSTGFAVVSNSGISSGGKSGAASAAAGGNVQTGINQIIQQLGGQAGAYEVSIGKRGDYFRVSGSGATNLGDKKTGNISGLLYDGTDEAEATRIALLNAIQDGAVKGIRAGAQRLLSAGKDLDAGLAKAIKFQGVFDQLKQATDPAGYALDQLNKTFADLKSVFDEASASTEEYGQLQQLYDIQRKQAVEQVTQQLTGAYKSLLNDLLTGDNGLSLRDRLTNARATFDPLAADVAAGKTVDAQAFADAAKTVIDISRQLYGSQDGYFAAFDQVTGLAKTALAAQDGLITAAANKDSPFTSAGAVANDNQPLIGAIGDQTDAIVAQLSVLNTNVARLVSNGGAGGSSGSREFYPAVNF